jgi:hypothetical protein
MIKANCETKGTEVIINGRQITARLNFYPKDQLVVMRRFLETCERLNRMFVDNWQQRRLNYTEFSEVMIASHLGMGIAKSIKGGGNTFDLYDPVEKERIELKASWKSEGSPVSMRSRGHSWEISEKWDRLLYVDCSDALGYGSKIYEIPNNVLDESHVSNGENFKSCRLRGKERIMINLQQVVEKNLLKPIDVCHLP